MITVATIYSLLLSVLSEIITSRAHKSSISYIFLRATRMYAAYYYRKRHGTDRKPRCSMPARRFYWSSYSWITVELYPFSRFSGRTNNAFDSLHKQRRVRNVVGRIVWEMRNPQSCKAKIILIISLIYVIIYLDALTRDNN